ncbi:phosphorylase family protein [Anaeromyxobacter diazotrophicus]|uniref:Nucleoside phosphorylase domain-containing protein n=1 Tax=Anaeromyxobacter diazotrophicus TaxID=2590199 RepID=A0A7I9VNY7_9BACT|nr:hypothetical protein [Anaeromyxobacter diazotrophicus]GEJ58131.1 hypothetical protein AMYX_28720 [Anaeromyxobacter diazotrophicus]
MIVVCAATGTEADACRRGIADAGAAGFEVLETGVGPARAAAALARWLEGGPGVVGRPPRPRAALAVSTGFAGALTAGVAPLAWVTASSLHRLAGGRAVEVVLPPGLLRVAAGATACQLLTAGEALAGPVAGLGPPAAVDMESAALGEVAGAAGIPFLVLRLVTDTPGRPLAPLGRQLARALSAEGAPARVAQGARAALEAVRAPGRAAAFIRESLSWRAQLRAGWRAHAAAGLPARPP